MNFRFVIAWLLLLAATVDGHLMLAGTGNRVSLPAPRVKVRSGLRLSIDTHWVTGSGYRPIVVRVAPILGTAAVAERYIDVRVRPRGWYPGEKAGAVTATVHLPQGAMYGEAKVNVPQTNAWNSLDITAYEDGKVLEDLEAWRMPLGARYFYDSSDGTPSVLILHRMALDTSTLAQSPAMPSYSLVMGPTPVSCASGLSVLPLLTVSAAPISQPGAGKKELSMLPDVRVLAGRFPMSYYNGYITADRFFAKTPVSDSETIRLIADLPFMGICNPLTLPDNWLSLSGIDIIVASLDDLRLLSAQYPEKLEAVRTWLSSGTLLCVYGVGTDFENLADLEELLEAPSLDKSDDKLRGWSKPTAKDYQEDIASFKDLVAGANWWQQQADIQRKAQTNGKTPTVDPVPPAKSPFVHRGLGQGHVVAWGADNPFPGTERDWSWMFNSVPARKWLWYQRHGVSNQRENRHYWNFLIEDIGRAPVLSFLALITMFAVVIGPMNYYFLHRRGRLYLLLVTVPIGAIVVTGGLFLYAAFADGLGTRAQVRSLTEIDQRVGRSVAWSRHMYYAGLAPSRGFVFPADAAVYPIEYMPVSNMGMADLSRHIVWGEEQNFVAGYFISRTPSQLLVVEPRRTKAGMMMEGTSSDGSPRLKNELGGAARLVTVRDSEGQFWRVTNLAHGATGTLTKTTKSDDSAQWSRLKSEHRLRYPEGFTTANLENVWGVFGSNFQFGGNTPPPSVDTSILETGLSWALNLNNMQPNSYLAVVERPSTVSLGVESADERSGFHIVVGKW